MPHPEFDRRLTQGELHVAVPTTAAAYIEERMTLLRSALDQTNALAREDQLPDAELNSAGLKISPLENSVPKEAEALRDALSSMLPHVKNTDLLMEGDRWTGFTRHFAHLKTNEPVKDPALLLTAILADATNLDLGKMAESYPGTSPAKLSWLVAWHIRMKPTQRLWQKSSSISTVFRSLRTGAEVLLPLLIVSVTAQAAAAKRLAR